MAIRHGERKVIYLILPEVMLFCMQIAVEEVNSKVWSEYNKRSYKETPHAS